MLGGYVAGSQALRDILIQRARPFLFSTSPPAGRRGRLPRGDPDHGQDEPELHRAAVGEHAPLQGRARPARLRHRPLGDADHAGACWATPRRRSGSRAGCSRRACSRPSVVFPTVALDQARIRTIVTAAHTRRACSTRALAAFDRVGRELGVIARVTVDRATARPVDTRARAERRARGLPGRDSSTGLGDSRDLPLDAHLHTVRSPDADAQLEAYCALAVERGIAEIAITDHVDFDPTHARLRLRLVRGPGARRPRGGRALGRPRARRSGSASRSPTSARYEDEIRGWLRRHPHDYVIG